MLLAGVGTSNKRNSEVRRIPKIPYCVPGIPSATSTPLGLMCGVIAQKSRSLLTLKLLLRNRYPSSATNMSLTALESAFAFYASYHSDKTNQLIHIFCVWPILFTAQIFLAYTPAVLPAYPIANWSLIVSVFYMLYYFIIEQPGIAGPIASALVLGGYLFATAVHASTPDVWKIALFVHVACWAAQIYGHQAHEGRSPAFLDNMAQALLFAPLFVLLEVMFHFGYKPEFQKKATALASKNIAEFRHARAEAARQKNQ